MSQAKTKTPKRSRAAKKPKAKPADDTPIHTVETKEQIKARLMAERTAARAEREQVQIARLETTRDRGRRPSRVSSEIVDVAPGRGPLVEAPMSELFPAADGSYHYVPSGYRGRVAARVQDAFDRMKDYAERSGRPFALRAAQIETGRRYGEASARVMAGGVKLSNLEATGGGGGVDVAPALLDAIGYVRSMHEALGSGISLKVRRVRVGEERKRFNIADRTLVDLVCIADLTISEVLRKHGWAENSHSRAAAQFVLINALRRMG